MAVKGTRVRHLEARFEAAELFEDLVAAMRTVVVPDQIWLDSSIRIFEGAGKLDEKLFVLGISVAGAVM